MTTLITTGNLTRDAEEKTSKDGRKYVLLQVAENIYKRDENGTIIKNAEGHNETLQTMFYSVFVHEKAGALTASKLKKGETIKVVGKAKINIEKDANDFDKYVIDSISAYSIDTDPFRKSSEEEVSLNEEVTDTPL